VNDVGVTLTGVGALTFEALEQMIEAVGHLSLPSEATEPPSDYRLKVYAPGTTRTCGLLLRRQSLYPPELRARG
jgi:hypothetical protein